MHVGGAKWVPVGVMGGLVLGGLGQLGLDYGEERRKSWILGIKQERAKRRLLGESVDIGDILWDRIQRRFHAWNHSHEKPE